MKKSDLISLLNEIFIPIGFVKKSNYWVLTGSELTKMINLQKSNFGNFFYLNFGYIINGLELTTKMHVEQRLASSQKDEQKLISKVFDLDTDLPIQMRFDAMRKIVDERVLAPLMITNTSQDLLLQIKKLPTLNILPLTVKRHFQLS